MTKELRSLLSEGKTPSAIHSLDLPTLDLLLKEAGSTRDGLVKALHQAIDAVDDPIYRAAAHDLFPLPFTDMGWVKLSVRGQRAADRFGIGYDGFRRELVTDLVAWTTFCGAWPSR